MLQKKDTTVLTLALLCAIAAAQQSAAASIKFAPVLAQTPTPTALPTPTAVPNATTLRINSSSSMEKVNAALKQSFEQQFPSKQVTIEYGDANAALRAVRQEKADLAAIGRPLTRREKARGLVAVPVSRNKIAIVVGENNPFTGSLTDQQFARIFRGEINNWSELGGAPGRIRVIDRPATSDTRQALSEYPVFGRRTFDTGVTAVRLSEDSTPAVIKELGTDGIGIAIADQVLNQPGVRVIPMHKTTPDDPKYPFSQPLFYVYKKTNTSPALQAFLGYVTTPHAQSAIAQAATTPPPAGAIAPGVTTSPTQPATLGATPTATVTIPGSTPSPTQLATPGATASPTQLAAPGATPAETVTIPASTPSPQTTVLTSPAADAAAGTSSDRGVLGMWWLWLSGLLLFLLWGWLKNKRQQPQSNQHLSLSSLDLIEPGESPRVDKLSPTPKETLIVKPQLGEAVKSEPTPTASTIKDESTPIAPSTIPPSAIATSAAVAASGLVARSAISDSSDVSPSPTLAEDESLATPPAISDTTTTVPGVSLPQVSQVTAETTVTTPAVTEESGIATSELVTEPAIYDTSDVYQPTAPQVTDIAEESTRAIPSVNEWTAIATSGLVTDAAIAASHDSQPIETTPTQVSEITSETPVTQPSAIASSGAVQPLAEDGSFVASSESIEPNTAEVSKMTEDTSATTLAAMEDTSGLVTDAAIAASHDSQPIETTPTQVSEITSETPVTQPSAIASSGAVQPLAEDDSFVASSESIEPNTAEVSKMTEDTSATTLAAMEDTSGLVTDAAIAASHDSQPIETTPTQVSEITSETPVTQPSAIASSGAVQPLAEDDSFVASLKSNDPNTAEVSNITEETAATTPAAMEGTAIATSGLFTGAAIAASHDSQQTEATPPPVSEMTSETTVPQSEAIADSGAENRVPGDVQPVENDFHPVEETPPQVSEITAETTETTIGMTEASAIATGAALATGAAMLSAEPHKESDREEVQAATFDTTQTEKANIATAVSNETAEVGEESRIVLLSREPEWAYTYWTIPNEQKEKLRQEGGTQLALRLYDVTDIDINNQPPQSIGQNICNEESQDAYLLVPTRDRDYMVEIGYLTDSDRWLILARSAVVRIPPSSTEDVQLADVEFEAMRLLSVPPVSPEILSSSAGKLGVTNLLETDMSVSASSTAANNTRTRIFRLVADAELSVYGETEPDATVTIDGRQIELKPNGTFRCQMLFLDGTKESTITAVAADGEIYSIHMKFTRETQKPNNTHLT